MLYNYGPTDKIISKHTENEFLKTCSGLEPLYILTAVGARCVFVMCLL